MRHARYLSIRRPKGGTLSNITKLEKDFAKTVSFGKTDATKLSPDQIKKKFSI